jgi:membrane protein DedA with SNARE-associated domain
MVSFTAQSRALGVENATGMTTVGALASAAGAIVIYFVSLKVGRAAIAQFAKRVRVSEQERSKRQRDGLKSTDQLQYLLEKG